MAELLVVEAQLGNNFLINFFFLLLPVRQSVGLYASADTNWPTKEIRCM